MKRVVLVRAIGPRNVGMVMRTVANFGPCELVLVAPARRSLLVHPDFVQMAHGVEGVREKLRIVATLPEALAECTTSIGFTARKRGDRWRGDWREAREGVAERCAAREERVALVFGSEETGLSGDELAHMSEVYWLPTAREHTSLNLSIAVGVVLYSLFHGEGVHDFEGGKRLANGVEREYLKRALAAELGRHSRSDKARADLTRSIERLFTRAPLEKRDFSAWTRLLRALGSELTPRDFGLAPTAKKERRKTALAERATKPARRPRAR